MGVRNRAIKPFFILQNIKTHIKTYIKINKKIMVKTLEKI
jgi:hypothetical protein